ncbi:MAG: ATP-binding protein [Bacteroidetes bacterium HGW-Bacteroidetes-7]|jgi:anti-sigma regulatory factor (Ser/Thr protein kinase)|nr:MAG: ATP-binding protein [Bacteroidetes bacterium HGW-Bacteroidetes-7]
MDNHNNKRSLLISNKIDELSKVAIFLEELGISWGMPDYLTANLNLVIEEALSNTILYGYDDADNHSIEIILTKSDGQISITIKDDGLEFDPTKKRDPDTTLSAEERPVGGLGIFLIKQLMDNVQYLREEKINYLILTKNITL